MNFLHNLLELFTLEDRSILPCSFLRLDLVSECLAEVVGIPSCLVLHASEFALLQSFLIVGARVFGYID